MTIKYRSRTDIVAQILQVVNRHGSVNKTRIMYYAFLSYEQLNEYLAMAVRNGLLEYGTATQTYKITEKGLKYLEIYEQLEELTSGEAKQIYKLRAGHAY